MRRLRLGGWTRSSHFPRKRFPIRLTGSVTPIHSWLSVEAIATKGGFCLAPRCLMGVESVHRVWTSGPHRFRLGLSTAVGSVGVNSINHQSPIMKGVRRGRRARGAGRDASDWIEMHHFSSLIPVLVLVHGSGLI